MFKRYRRVLKLALRNRLFHTRCDLLVANSRYKRFRCDEESLVSKCLINAHEVADVFLALAASALGGLVSAQEFLLGLKVQKETLAFRSQSLCRHHGIFLPRAVLSYSGKRVLCLIKSSFPDGDRREHYTKIAR